MAIPRVVYVRPSEHLFEMRRLIHPESAPRTSARLSDTRVCEQTAENGRQLSGVEAGPHVRERIKPKSNIEQGDVRCPHDAQVREQILPHKAYGVLRFF
jgi:hypothetical protein